MAPLLRHSSTVILKSTLRRRKLESILSNSPWGSDVWGGAVDFSFVSARIARMPAAQLPNALPAWGVRASAEPDASAAQFAN